MASILPTSPILNFLTPDENEVQYEVEYETYYHSVRGALHGRRRSSIVADGMGDVHVDEVRERNREACVGVFWGRG